MVNLPQKSLNTKRRISQYLNINSNLHANSANMTFSLKRTSDNLFARFPDLSNLLLLNLSRLVAEVTTDIR